LEAVQPVQFTRIEEWIERGENQHFVLKRLINADKLLNDSNLLKMRRVGEFFFGKNYDIYFEWTDEKLYCSELIWKIYKYGANIEICNLEKLSDFNLSNHLVKNELNKRYGKNFPLNETAIPPSALFNSEKLKEIIKN